MDFLTVRFRNSGRYFLFTILFLAITAFIFCVRKLKQYIDDDIKCFCKVLYYSNTLKTLNIHLINIFLLILVKKNYKTVFTFTNFIVFWVFIVFLAFAFTSFADFIFFSAFFLYHLQNATISFWKSENIFYSCLFESNYENIFQFQLLNLAINWCIYFAV